MTDLTLTVWVLFLHTVLSFRSFLGYFLYGKSSKVLMFLSNLFFIWSEFVFPVHLDYFKDCTYYVWQSLPLTMKKPSVMFWISEKKKHCKTLGFFHCFCLLSVDVSNGNLCVSWLVAVNFLTWFVRNQHWKYSLVPKAGESRHRV